MSGHITIRVRGPETEYTPACDDCDWVGDTDASLDWAEVVLQNHFYKAHQEAEAA
jgi:hypothetical protein